MNLWLMQAPAVPASAAPLYRPFMILFIILLMAILTAVIYYLWKQSPDSDAHPDEFTSVEKFKELVRSILTATLTAGFIVLTFEDKIDAGIFGNTYAIIIAFWFGQKLGEQNRQKTNGASPTATTVTTPPPTTVTVTSESPKP